jgi:hypothetical protein
MNLRDISKQIGVNQTGLRKLVDSKYNSYNGWTVVGTPHISRNISISRSKRSSEYPRLISPDGTIYRIEDTIRSFCRFHNLTPSSVSKLINKKIPSYKGWFVQEILHG